MFGTHHHTGQPKQLVYNFETGNATLEVWTATKTLRLWAEGGIAHALLRQVRKETTTIVVTVDRSDPTKIVAFTLP